MLERLWAELIGRRRQFALAVAAGGLYGASFCGYEQWFLAWLCLVPVLWALDDVSLSPRFAFLIGWTTGATAHLAVYTWIITMLRDFGNLPWPLAILGYVLLTLGQSGMFGFWGLAVHQLHVRLKVPIVWAAPVCMVLAEWLYPQLFPSYFANTQYRQLVLTQSADIWGVLGIGFLLTLASAVVYGIVAKLVRRRGRLPVYAAIAFVALMVFDIVYGTAAISNIDDTVAVAARKIRVGMVQTNMGIYDKTGYPAEGLRRHREQSLEVERQGAQLIVWPESGYYYAMPSDITNVAGPVLGPVSTPLIFGALRIDRDEAGKIHAWNTAYIADGAGNILGSYDKTYLLAFGEYLPFGDWIPALYEISPNSSAFDRGTSTEPLVYDGIKYGMLICYEDILPRFVNRVMEHEPDILVNLTNDAWFGPGREPLIHLALATFRSIEHRRYMIRSTNTGISAYIDPAGRILGETPVYARANSVADIAPLQVHTIYSKIGDLLAWLCLGIFLWWIRPWFRGLYIWSKRKVRSFTGPRSPARSSEPGDRDESARAPSSPSGPRPRPPARRRR